jgi:methyl-accepting chemotaxis protein PixJ
MEKFPLKIFPSWIALRLPEAKIMEEAEMTTSSDHSVPLPIQDDPDSQQNLSNAAPQSLHPSLLPSALSGAAAVAHLAQLDADDLRPSEQFYQSAGQGYREGKTVRQTDTTLKTKALLLAMAIGMLPALSVGTATYFFGQRMLEQTVIQAEQTGGVSAVAAMEQRHQQYSELLTLLLMGTGAIALFFGALAALWANRMMRSAEMLGATTADDDGQQLFLQESRTLTDVISRIHRARDEQAIFEAAVKGLREVLRCDRIVLYRFNNGSGGEVVAESVAPGLPKALGSTLHDPYSLAGQGNLGNNNSYAIDNLGDILLLPADFQQLEALQVQSSLGAMLQREQEPFGSLMAQSCQQQRHWLPSEVALIEHLATEMGFALEHTQRSSERDILEQRLLLETNWKAYFEETTRLIHSASEPEVVASTAVEEIRRTLDSDRVLFCHLTEQNQGMVVAEAVAPGHTKTLGQSFIVPNSESDYGQMVQDGRISVIDNVDEAGFSLDTLEQLSQLNIRASIVAPVWAEGKLAGLLMVYHGNPRHWNDLEVRWLKQISMQVGYALDYATHRQPLAMPLVDAYNAPGEQLQQVQEARAIAARLVSSVAQQRTQVAAVTAQLQGVADATRLVVGKVQKAEQELPNVGQVLQEGYEHINQMIDILSELQETVAGYANQSHYLSASAQSISQSVHKIHDLAEHIGQTSIHLSILSGQSREDIQSAVSTIAETVLDSTRQIMATTAKLAPMATQIESESQSIMHGMEVGTEQVLVGTELVKETRYKLNQLTQYGDRVDQLVQRIVETSPTQSQTLTAITQQMQDMTSLVNHILEQATELSESLHPPNSSDAP